MHIVSTLGVLLLQNNEQSEYDYLRKGYFNTYPYEGNWTKIVPGMEQNPNLANLIPPSERGSAKGYLHGTFSSFGLLDTYSWSLEEIPGVFEKKQKIQKFGTESTKKIWWA